MTILSSRFAIAVFFLSSSTSAQQNVACPVDFETPLELSTGSSFIIPKSSVNTLCTLSQVNSDRTKVVPVGRSYDGNDFERVAGKFADQVSITCDNTACLVEVPALPGDGSVYQLTSFESPTYYSNDDVIARFLEQTTFGPKRSEIDSISSSSPVTNLDFANWIKTQETLPYMSHREIFRARTNTRFEVGTPAGRVTQPCEGGTRYRRWAFSTQDEEKSLEFSSLGGNKRELTVDGYFRTVVDAPTYIVNNNIVTQQNFPTNLVYTICGVYESMEEGLSALSVYHPNLSACVVILFIEGGTNYFSNPPVQFDGGVAPSNSFVLTLDAGDAQAIDEEYFQGFNPALPEIITTQDIDDTVCTTGGGIPKNNTEPVFATWNNELFIHDPRFRTLDNTLQSPLTDGGGQVYQDYDRPIDPRIGTMCSNVPRSFVNEGSCFLSTSESACSYRSELNGGGDDGGDDQTPPSTFEMTGDLIKAIYTATGEGLPGTTYLYAVDDLRAEDDIEVDPPCQPGVTSRWVSGPCSGEPFNTQLNTRSLMQSAIDYYQTNGENNPNMVDVYFPTGLAYSCAAADNTKKGFEVPDKSDSTICWRNVHPDHLNVYDFTIWTEDHPGNSADRNPIKEFAEAGSSVLVFPDWHELTRWQDNKQKFGQPSRLGDQITLDDLPLDVRTDEDVLIEIGLGAYIPSDPNQGIGSGPGTLVCGSPHEIANDPDLGGSFGKGAFDIDTILYQFDGNTALGRQREEAWTIATLTDEAQLRQRIAWALSQILVVSPDSITEGEEITEAYLAYYDIFVRNAFGNYRDVLKEVSYSVMMADMLTYFQGRSTEYVREEEGTAEFADENYAREIMQLFTTGLLKLNVDGTVMVDIGGNSELVYTNDDIEEYARAWTGFDGQETRGNMEQLIGNRIDPMKINPLWRDQLPKMGLDGTYIGDGYPQCSDIPEKHFLMKGATYYLLGNTPLPELQSDPVEWQKNGITMSLDSSSDLYGKLCVTDGANCLFPTKVILDETITCNGDECSVDTVRTVEVSDGIYYEYVRPPCVHETFYDNAKTIVPRNDADNTMCGNPLIETASVACCQGTDSGAWAWDELYFGERNLFSTASDRCNSNLCNSNNRPVCDPESDSRCLSNNYFWTAEDCQVKVKVRADGKVAVVHSPQNEANEDVASKVQEDTSTFFRVDWDGDFSNLLSNCASTAGCGLSNDGNYCICEVSVSEEQVFVSSVDAATILSSLHIGAFETEIESRNEVVLPGGIFAYVDPNEGVGPGTILKVTDSNGVQQLRKNKLSKVSITGSLSFRNPPHLINLADPEARDAHYETDATLDHYFYHPNTPPFLAIRFAQRFGISNASPRYVEAVSLAFTTGSFTYSDGSTSVEFGSGEYGDLAATFACILLDREARSVVLDADSSHGAFKEPLIKVLGTMRSLEFELREDVPWASFGDLDGRIGQMAHQLPSVFSFFLPEYQPSGPISDASLVAPESQVLTGPRIIGSMNGILALLKYGLNPCLGGFGETTARYDEDLHCNTISISDTDKSLGSLTFSPTDSGNAASVVDELATLLTAGRLSPESRQIIESTYDSSDPSALVKAQMLISTTPEFHSTNIVRQNGGQRESEPLPPPSTLPYKAVVYVQLEGGYDSYNMLVPHTCSVTNGNGETLLDQYISERTTIALTAAERSERPISATGQPCSEFAVHPNLPIVQQLYNNGDLSFFANTGVLDAPVTKDNYNQETKTQLFAHNTMQQESQRIDPLDTTPGTGILGRMCDVLQDKGFTPQPITIDDATVATVGVPGEAIPPLIVSSREQTRFAPRPNNENFDVTDFVGALNSETDLHTSLYGETWSQKLIQSIADADRIADALENTNLSQDYSNKGRYAQHMEVLSGMIMTQTERGIDRDVFFVKLRGWDHHDNMKANLASNFDDLNSALDLFQSEMKAQGYWDKVTMVITSDFGRTLTANSQDGSDHAWGGNYFALGGDVAGGKIHGSYPPDITESGPLNVGRGRLIPTMSWESIWNSVAEWMGLAGGELEYCMPNRLNTGAEILLSEQDVFQQRRVRKLRGT